jgi:hypothetical protein
VQPFQPAVAHPLRRALDRAGVKIERRPPIITAFTLPRCAS